MHRSALIGILVVILAVPAVFAETDGTRTRIVESACGRYAPPPSARGFGDSVVGAVIQNTLGRLGAALRSAGEASTRSTVVHRNIEVKPAGAAKCLIVARGRWSATGSDTYKDLSGSEIVYVGTASEKLLADPDFVLRLEVDRSRDHSALKLRPAYLEYGRHLSDTSRSARGISFEIAFHGAGQASDHKDAVGTTLVLGDFLGGHRYDLQSGAIEKWDRRDRRWEKAEGLQLPLQEESHWFPTYAPTPVDGADANALKQRTPKIVTVTLAETRAARPMLLFLADVFDASDDDLNASLESKLLRSKREEAQTAAAKAQNEQLVELVTAVADAQLAVENYCVLGAGRSRVEYLKARKELFVAMNKANFVASGLGQPLPFASVPTPSPEDPVQWGQCPQ